MPRWRWPSWLIAVWTVLDVLFWAVVWVGMINDPKYADQPVADLIGAVIVGSVVWLVPMAVLGPIWYFTKKQTVACPACGAAVQTSWNVCPRCGCPVLPYRAYAAPGQFPPYPPQYGQQYGQQFAPPAAPWGAAPTPRAYPQTYPAPQAYPAPQPNTFQPPSGDPWAAPAQWPPSPPAGQPPEDRR